MKPGFSRHFAFERDADGQIFQMVWLGDWPDRPNVLFTACPRCQSSRWVSASCLDCWYRAPRTWDEANHDEVYRRAVGAAGHYRPKE